MHERKSAFTSLEVELSVRERSSKFYAIPARVKDFLSSLSLCLTCQWHYEAI